jgi:hypothetical protein
VVEKEKIYLIGLELLLHTKIGKEVREPMADGPTDMVHHVQASVVLMIQLFDSLFNGSVQLIHNFGSQLYYVINSTAFL